MQIERGDVAHQLIEEFMLLANRSIASWLAEREQAAVYRVHGEPNEEKLEQFVEQLAIYGIDGIDPFDRQGLQQILGKLRNEPEASRQVLNYLLLRSFSKAVYQVENIGHFALAFSHYVHFTSPIRRYPDLIVHRLVKYHLGLEAYKDVETRLEFLDAFAKQCTWLEQRAESAERDLHARKAARYLAQRVGEVSSGVVLSAAGAGLFIHLLETGLEALLPLRELKDDYYQFDRERLALIGSKTGRVFSIGCPVMCKLSPWMLSAAKLLWDGHRNLDQTKMFN